MKLRHVILLPILFVAFYLSSFPSDVLAAEWSIVGSPEKNVKSFGVEGLTIN